MPRLARMVILDVPHHIVQRGNHHHRKEVAVPSNPEISGIDIDWRAVLRVEPEEAGYVQEKLRTGRPCGNRRFVRRLEKLTGRTLTPRPPGHPKGSTQRKKRK